VSEPIRCPYCGGELAEDHQRELHAAANDIAATPDDGWLAAWRRSSACHTRAFVRFHDANPHVFDELVRLARQWAIEHPGRLQSIELLFAKLRCESDVRTTGDSYKLNKHYQAYYSRLIMESEPSIAFETRRAIADVFADPGQLELFGDDEEARSAHPEG
jgi:hypothetical protein